jgi:hypothetical protein
MTVFHEAAAEVLDHATGDSKLSEELLQPALLKQTQTKFPIDLIDNPCREKLKSSCRDACLRLLECFSPKSNSGDCIRENHYLHEPFQANRRVMQRGDTRPQTKAEAQSQCTHEAISAD